MIHWYAHPVLWLRAKRDGVCTRCGALLQERWVNPFLCFGGTSWAKCSACRAEHESHFLAHSIARRMALSEQIKRMRNV